MGFLNPWAWLALPLALLPLVLDRMGRRRGAPLRFSSLYLLERARRSSVRRTTARAPWTALLRALAVAALVVAASRPVGPGAGSPAHHRPTRAIVAVDVSRSTAQAWNGATAWTWIAAAADSVLAAAGPDDELALAAVADGLVGWWDGPAEGLRRRLSSLGPTGRASDWPSILEALAGRAEADSETYLFTDGARGAGPPDPTATVPVEGYRVLRTWPAPPASNRAIVETPWVGPGEVAIRARGWGLGTPVSIEAGRRVGERLVEPRAIPLAEASGSPSAATWAVGDTATLALAATDRLPADDRVAVARRGRGPYRVVRWAPPDRPPEPGTLFWEAALASARRSSTIETVSSLSALIESAPDLALLPIRSYGPTEAASLRDLVEGGARLLFAPECADPACAPGRGWSGSAGPDLPALEWRLPSPGRATVLAPRPSGSEGPGGIGGVPDHLAARVAVRGGLRVGGGPEADWTWDLLDGTSALWVRGRVAVWLLPFGPPVTRLGTTPLFPLVADAILARWDPRWTRAGTVRVGEPVPLPDSSREVVVTGPLGRETPRRWTVGPEGLAPRPERAGLYRIEADSTGFVAVRADPAEGDLRPIAASTWRTGAWGGPPLSVEAWPDALFPRRRGPERTRGVLVVALAMLATSALVRRRERRRGR